MTYITVTELTFEYLHSSGDLVNIIRYCSCTVTIKKIQYEPKSKEGFAHLTNIYKLFLLQRV